jgi:hypothetical protein
VVFGRVVAGMDVVKRIEAVGSKSGTTTKRVAIEDCGTLDDEAVRAAEAARAAALSKDGLQLAEGACVCCAALRVPRRALCLRRHHCVRLLMRPPSPALPQRRARRRRRGGHGRRILTWRPHAASRR